MRHVIASPEIAEAKRLRFLHEPAHRYADFPSSPLQNNDVIYTMMLPIRCARRLSFAMAESMLMISMRLRYYITPTPLDYISSVSIAFASQRQLPRDCSLLPLSAMESCCHYFRITMPYPEVIFDRHLSRHATFAIAPQLTTRHCRALCHAITFTPPLYARHRRSYQCE